MRSRTVIRGRLWALAVAVAAGCGDPSGPAAARGGAPLAATAPSTVPIIQRATPLAEPLSATQVVDSRGGVIALAGTGLRVAFPKGALAAPTTITVTAPAGSDVVYGFEPHGIQFAQAVTVQQDLGYVHVEGVTSDAALSGAYYADDSALLGGGQAIASEVYPVTLDLSKNTARFSIRHFSGYMFSSGSTDGSTAP